MGRFHRTFMCWGGCWLSLSVEALALDLEVLHLHTYFLFPITIDQDAVMDEHPKIWRRATLVRPAGCLGYGA